MNILPYPDPFHLDAAVGWMMLGNHQEAVLELGKLTPASRQEPDVLELEWSIHASAQQWDNALHTARMLMAVAPERPAAHVHQAYSLRRVTGGGLQRAYEALLPAADKFPKESIIPYNLACYTAQMGNLAEAWNWMIKATERAEPSGQIKKMALADPDLEPLWDRIRKEFLD